MKKILPMILLLSISLPSLAVEVKLRCEYVETLSPSHKGETISIIFKFDEEKGTVNDSKPSSGGRISDTEIREDIYGISGAFLYSKTLDRMTGAYAEKFFDGNVYNRGTCVPFKKAF